MPAPEFSSSKTSPAAVPDAPLNTPKAEAQRKFDLHAARRTAIARESLAGGAKPWLGGAVSVKNGASFTGTRTGKARDTAGPMPHELRRQWHNFLSFCEENRLGISQVRRMMHLPTQVNSNKTALEMWNVAGRPAAGPLGTLRSALAFSRELGMGMGTALHLAFNQKSMATRAPEAAVRLRPLGLPFSPDGQLEITVYENTHTIDTASLLVGNKAHLPIPRDFDLQIIKAVSDLHIQQKLRGTKHNGMPRDWAKLNRRASSAAPFGEMIPLDQALHQGRLIGESRPRSLLDLLVNEPDRAKKLAALELLTTALKTRPVSAPASTQAKAAPLPLPPAAAPGSSSIARIYEYPKRMLAAVLR